MGAFSGVGITSVKPLPPRKKSTRASMKFSFKEKIPYLGLFVFFKNASGTFYQDLNNLQQSSQVIGVQWDSFAE